MTSADEQARELSTFLSHLPESTLLTITAGAMMQKHPNPSEMISSLLQLCSTLCTTLDDRAQTKTIGEFRNIADRLESPLLQARIARNWN